MLLYSPARKTRRFGSITRQPAAAHQGAPCAGSRSGPQLAADPHVDLQGSQAAAPDLRPCCRSQLRQIRKTPQTEANTIRVYRNERRPLDLWHRKPYYVRDNTGPRPLGRAPHTELFSYCSTRGPVFFEAIAPGGTSPLVLPAAPYPGLRPSGPRHCAAVVAQWRFLFYFPLARPRPDRSPGGPQPLTRAHRAPDPGAGPSSQHNAGKEVFA